MWIELERVISLRTLAKDFAVSLKAQGIKTYPTETYFFPGRIPHMKSDEFAKALSEKNIHIRHLRVDVKKAINMFRKMDMRILVIVENMSCFECSHSEEKIEIFGTGGGEKLSHEMDVPFLEAIPIDIELRKGGDKGVPLMAETTESWTTRVFREIAGKVVSHERVAAK